MSRLHEPAFRRGALRRATRAVALLALLACLAGCTYLRHVQRQDRLAGSLRTDPELRTLKHLLDRERFTIYGRIAGAAEAAPPGKALAVVAVSSALKPDEIVDVCHLGRSGSYYALNLPAGRYRLVVLRDLDEDGRFEAGEVVHFRRIELTDTTAPDRVLRLDDLEEHAPRTLALATLPLAVPPDPARGAGESLFYPRGTIRSLDDPVFAAPMVELGMYDPAAFTETAPLMFYALEEEFGHKIPVIFVHGIGGSARNFAAIVERMDRRRHRPWFFHYPSGADLEQTARIFHDIFLSGKVIPASPMPVIIVAHSMGGLVVREALNLHTGAPGEANVRLVITIATPFGGMASARVGVRHAPIVVPAWRDLAPDSPFIAALYRQPRAAAIEHRALYAARRLREGGPAHGGSDGVVPVASQLAPRALSEFSGYTGFQADHAGILVDPAAVEHVLALIGAVPNLFPEDHLRFADLGGFDEPLGEDASPIERYLIRHYGRQMRALAHGVIGPIAPEQARFVAVARGEAAPDSINEVAWLRFQRDHPALAAEVEQLPDPGH